MSTLPFHPELLQSEEGPRLKDLYVPGAASMSSTELKLSTHCKMRRETNPRRVDEGGKDLGTVQRALRGGEDRVYSRVFMWKLEAIRLGRLCANNGKPLEAKQEDSCPKVFLLLPDLSGSQSLFIVQWGYGFSIK